MSFAESGEVGKGWYEQRKEELFEKLKKHCLLMKRCPNANLCLPDLSIKKFDETYVRLCPNPAVRTWISEFAEDMDFAEKHSGKRQVEERRRKLDEAVNRELEDIINLPERVVQESDAIALSDQPVKADYAWWDDVQRAWLAFQKKGILDATTRELAQKFVAFFEPQFKVSSEFTSSKNIIESDLLPVGIPNANSWEVPESEVNNILKQLNSQTIPLIDTHEKGITAILGVIKEASYDSTNRMIKIKAELKSARARRLINEGLVKHVSLGAEADGYCSKCGAKLKNPKEPHCPGSHAIVKNMRVKEVSLLGVTDPAWKESVIKKFYEED